MFGSGNPTPYDIPLIVFLVAIGILMLVGAATHASWSPTTATLVRRGAAIVGLIAVVVVHRVTPTTNGIIGAARVLFVWPAIAFAVIGFAVWSWKVGRI